MPELNSYNIMSSKDIRKANNHLTSLEIEIIEGEEIVRTPPT